ncbi:MAG: transcription termination/antitermination protein NusG [Psittacicella sp.]
MENNAVDAKRWYIVQVYSGTELSVLDSLNEYISQYNMEEYFGDILVPREQVIENLSGKQKRTERKFFPGYVFVQMVMNRDNWHFVKNIPNVMRFIGGSAEDPAPISDEEALSIISHSQKTQDNPVPKTVFQAGESVRVIEGAFKDFNASVEAVDYEKSKLKVNVSIFGRSTPVELLFSQIEKNS